MDPGRRGVWRRRGVLPAALGLVVLVLALYAPSLGNPLIWDDEIHVSRMRGASFAEAFTRSEGEYRRPVVLLSYWAQDRLGLGGAAAQHAVNLALHAANALLLLALLLRLGTSSVVAIAAAALFVAHPLQSAAVAYVSGRTDLLATLFLLLALGGTWGVSAGGVSLLRRVLGVAAASAAALLSKETGLLAGPLVAALWYLRRATPSVAEAVPDDHPRSEAWLPGVALAVSLLGLVFVGPPALAEAVRVEPATALRGTGATLATYLGLLVHPVDLHLDRLTPVVGTLHAVLGVGVLLALGAAGVAFLRRPTLPGFGFAALALAYLPVSGLVPVYPAIAGSWAFTPEHFLYLPLAALLPLAAAGLARGVELVSAGLANAPERIGATALGLVVLLLVAGAFPAVQTRQAQFAHAESVYRATLVHSPSPRACFNLGVALLRRGAYADAATTYMRCARISPHDAEVWMQLGVAHQGATHWKRAEQAYERALELDPASAAIWSNTASLDATRGRFERARERWRRALGLDPDHSPAREGLARLDRLQRRMRAIEP